MKRMLWRSLWIVPAMIAHVPDRERPEFSRVGCGRKLLLLGCEPERNAIPSDGWRRLADREHEFLVWRAAGIQRVFRHPSCEESFGADDHVWAGAFISTVQQAGPFGNLQIGAIHASQGYLGISESAFKFDLTGGGGIDYDINSRAAIRAEGDYVMTRFLDLRQDNLRFSVGLVIHLGPSK